jgi:hypothetical protein
MAAAAVASRPPSSSCKRTAMYLCLLVFGMSSVDLFRLGLVRTRPEIK